MMQKRLLSLLLITVAVLGIGVFLARGQKPQTEGALDGGPLVAGLEQKLNSVNSVILTGAGNATLVELNLRDEAWVVGNRNGHPADVAKLREFLIKLAESRLREEKTSKPENYTHLNVEDLAEAEAKGVMVELKGLDKPAKLIIGMLASGGSTGTFVRRHGEATSFLASGSLLPEREPAAWLAKNILDIPSSRVRTVRIEAPDKALLEIAKDDQAAVNYAVLNLPRGRELSSESAANLIAGVLAGLNLEDVQAADGAEPEDGGIWQLRFTTYEGLAILVRGWDADGRFHARFEAVIDDPQLDAWVAAEKARADAERATALAAVESAQAATDGNDEDAAATDGDNKPDASSIPAEFDTEAARSAKLTELEAEAATINQRTANWAYALPGWKAANFKKRMDDLLAEK